MLDDQPRLLQQLESRVYRRAADALLAHDHRGVELVGIEVPDSVQHRLEHLEALRRRAIPSLRQELRKRRARLLLLLGCQHAILLVDLLGIAEAFLLFADRHT